MAFLVVLAESVVAQIEDLQSLVLCDVLQEVHEAQRTDHIPRKVKFFQAKGEVDHLRYFETRRVPEVVAAKIEHAQIVIVLCSS